MTVGKCYEVRGARKWVMENDEFQGKGEIQIDFFFSLF
jgi:hypothetical protein